MAKIVTSALVADVRKKIGGNVFTKGRAGAFVRRKVSPVQPRSAAQRNVRADFTSISKAWSGSSMDDTKRAAWNALAQQYPEKDRFGASHVLTGLQIFQKLNRILATIGLPPIFTPPATLTTYYPGALTVVATAPGTLTVASATYPTGTDRGLVYGAAQQSPGRTFVGKRYRFLASFTPADPTPWNIAAYYTAKFGSLISGKKVPILVKPASSDTGAAGIASAALQLVS